MEELMDKKNCVIYTNYEGAMMIDDASKYLAEEIINKFKDNEYSI